MASRGNEPATVPVRPHFTLAAGLLAAAAIAFVARAAQLPRVTFEVTLLALLAGLTLVAQGVAYWYMPSFAKRTVVPWGIAAYAGPILLPVGVAGALARIGPLRDVGLGLSLALFGFTLLASARFGAPWRGGVPFWRAQQPHRAGDRAALAALASAAALWLVLGAGLLLAPAWGAPALLLGWLVALALFTLGALAHLVPRGRGAPLRAPVFLAGVLAADAGALALLAHAALRGFDPLAATLLLAGLPVAALALPFQALDKPTGPRLREARPLLLAAGAVLVVATGCLVAGYPDAPRLVVAAHYAYATAGLLGVAGMATLALPVLFNQKPDARWAGPAVAAALAGLAIAGLSLAGRGRGVMAMLAYAAALAFVLAMFLPLRTPRRECTPRR